jgi:lysophospholipase L1-like esterase
MHALIRNDIARALIKGEGIPIDDQHELMARYSDQYEDAVHFNPTGAAIQGQQVAQSIRLSLAKR